MNQSSYYGLCSKQLFIAEWWWWWWWCWVAFLWWCINHEYCMLNALKEGVNYNKLERNIF